MYKLVSFARFRAGIDREEAARHWREVHGPLGAQVPGLLRYEQNHFVGRAPIPTGLAEEPPFHGYASLWFRDAEGYAAATASEQWQKLAEDGAAFLDEGGTMSASVDERTIVDGARTPYKIVAVAHFRTDMERQDASRYWTTVHGPLGVKHAPGFTCYVQNHVLDPTDLEPSSEGRTFDGFAEHWLTDREAYLETVSTPGWQAVVDDGLEVFDMDDLWEAEAVEVVIKG